MCRPMIVLGLLCVEGRDHAKRDSLLFRPRSVRFSGTNAQARTLCAKNPVFPTAREISGVPSGPCAQGEWLRHRARRLTLRSRCTECTGFGSSGTLSNAANR